MSKSISQLFQGRWRVLALSLFAFALPLQGCIVNNGSSRGSAVVQWALGVGTSCANVSSVNVVAVRDGTTYGTFTNGICSSGAMTIQVGEGAYTLHVEAIGYDGSVVATTPSETITVVAYNTVYSDILVLAPVSVATGGSSIQTAWTISGQAPAAACAANGIKSVTLSIYDTTQTQIIGSASAPCATGYATVANLPTGNYYVLLDGYTAADVTGHPSWGTPDFHGPFALAANTDMTFNAPLDISPLGNPTTGVGGLSVGWTVFGTVAATACTTYSLGALNITVLGADKTTVLGSAQAACSTGQVALSNLAAGTIYVRIDEANPPDTNAYGNVALTGPITIVANQTASVTAPIDIAQRTIIAVPVGFADAGSCSGHGVGSVQYQISGNDKLIVPFSDADATKPCDLSTAAYKQQVIDLDNSPPTCAVPGNVTGLVICNAHGITKLTIQAHGLTGNTIGYAAKMDVTPLTDGKLTVVKQPLQLQACGAGDPLCQ